MKERVSVFVVALFYERDVSKEARNMRGILGEYLQCDIDDHNNV